MSAGSFAQTQAEWPKGKLEHKTATALNTPQTGALKLFVLNLPVHAVRIFHNLLISLMTFGACFRNCCSCSLIKHQAATINGKKKNRNVINVTYAERLAMSLFPSLQAEETLEKS